MIYYKYNIYTVLVSLRGWIKTGHYGKMLMKCWYCKITHAQIHPIHWCCTCHEKRQSHINHCTPAPSPPAALILYFKSKTQITKYGWWPQMCNLCVRNCVYVWFWSVLFYMNSMKMIIWCVPLVYTTFHHDKSPFFLKSDNEVEKQHDKL